MSLKKDNYKSSEKKIMNFAINLAENNKYLTGTNPSVGCVIVKNNELLVAIERNEESKFSIVRETTQNFSEDKAKVLKEFYMGEFDLHVEFVRGYPVHIPVPNNKHYLSRKIEMINHCLLELKNNERKANLPKG